MKLSDDRELFERSILITADKLKINEALIEKDYYVSLFLSELTKRLPNLLFKGGTSLSKCHKVIRRFSEDIDLTICGDTFPKSAKKKVMLAVREACDELGLRITNFDKILYGMDYNNYEIEYPKKYYSEGIKPVINAETVFMGRVYPNEMKTATSILYDHLHSIDGEAADRYEDLRPFEIRVQSLTRTLVDKVFALCDYKLSDEISRNSRHIYDILRLLDHVKIDDKLRALVREVREDRKKRRKCLSAQDGMDVNTILQEIIESKIYQRDYEDVTAKMLYEDVPYDRAIQALNVIIESRLFESE